MDIRLRTLQTLNYRTKLQLNPKVSNCNDSGLKYIILLLDADTQ